MVFLPVKGMIEVGAVLVIILTTLGVFAVLHASKNIYVGDERTNELYNYDKCPDDVRAIPQEHQILFGTIRQAEEEGYHLIEGCV